MAEEGLIMEGVEASMVAMAASWRSAYQESFDSTVEAVLPAWLYDRRTPQEWEEARKRTGITAVRAYGL